MVPDFDEKGEWVLYSDHLLELERAKREVAYSLLQHPAIRMAAQSVGFQIEQETKAQTFKSSPGQASKTSDTTTQSPAISGRQTRIRNELTGPSGKENKQ